VITLASNNGSPLKVKPHVDLMVRDLISGFVANGLKKLLFESGNPIIIILLWSALIDVGN
jgi:hypothetical protein